MANKTVIAWLSAPESQDYPAAISYLGLVMDPASAKAISDRLASAPMSQYAAKDIFRASQLSLLGISNGHVDKDRQKISNGQALSPLLLFRDERMGRLVIADGYHRLCAVYSFDEDAMIPCKIV